MPPTDRLYCVGKALSTDILWQTSIFW